MKRILTTNLKNAKKYVEARIPPAAPVQMLPRIAAKATTAVGMFAIAVRDVEVEVDKDTKKPRINHIECRYEPAAGDAIGSKEGSTSKKIRACFVSKE